MLVHVLGRTTRIYITGQSMGGHLSYRSALSLPDRFGAVSPHSGGYDFVEKQSIGNLINVPGYAIWGVREPYGINVDNRTNRAWAEEHEMDWQFVEKNGGHEIYQDELPKVAEFFSERERNLYPQQVYLRAGGHMKFVKTWQIRGWPEHTIYFDERPLRWNMRHWIEVEPRPDHDGPLELMAENRGNNQIEIASENVRGLTVFLHPEMIDFDAPVSIRVNGAEVFSEQVEPDPALMFELAREFDDRGRVYFARVDLQIVDDGNVDLLE
ncbi:MAG: alpha/beta hydrolase-fold protein [Planctomycetota bacterium]